MRRRRKSNQCLNCGEPLDKHANYCPNCGQENTDHQISLGLLVREITSNFFSLDSRFARTLKPFLFSPGKITNAFIEGKRVLYANPIRWYLVISIIHFFFFSKLFEPTVKDRKNRGFDDNEIISPVEFDSLNNLPDSAHVGFPMSGEQEKMVGFLVEKTNLSSPEIIDSLNINSDGWFQDFFLKQYIKTKQETRASLNQYLVRQIPMIIFFLLPIYAFLLKVFFWRKGLYIKHLIHSIHLHSLLFFLLSLTWGFALIFEDFEDVGLKLTTVLMFVYAVISFKKVYGIRIRWSVVRTMLLGFVYMFVLVVALVVGVAISFALF